MFIAIRVIASRLGLSTLLPAISIRHTRTIFDRGKPPWRYPQRGRSRVRLCLPGNDLQFRDAASRATQEENILRNAFGNAHEKRAGSCIFPGRLIPCCITWYRRAIHVLSSVYGSVWTITFGWVVTDRVHIMETSCDRFLDVSGFSTSSRNFNALKSMPGI